MIADKETHDKASGRAMVGIQVPEVNDVSSDTFLLARLVPTQTTHLVIDVATSPQCERLNHPGANGEGRLCEFPSWTQAIHKDGARQKVGIRIVQELCQNQGEQLSISLLE